MSRKKRTIIFSLVIIILILIASTVYKFKVKNENISTYNRLTQAINQLATSNTLRTKTNINISNIDYSLTENSFLTKKQINALTNFFQNSSFTVETITDKQNNKLQFNITIWFDSERSTTFSIYFDSELVGFYFEELNNKAIYFKWDDLNNINNISNLIPPDLKLKQFKDALFSLNTMTFFNAPGIETIHNIFENSLSFTEFKNVKISTLQGKELKSTKYALVSTTEEIKKTLKEIVITIYNNEDLLNAFSTVFQDVYSIHQPELLRTVLINSKGTIINQVDHFLNSNRIENINFYIYKDKLSRITFQNTISMAILEDHLTMNTFITSDFAQVKKDYDWLTISTDSINLANLGSRGLKQFYKNFLLSGYSLSLKYPELLEVLSTFVIY